MRKPTRKQPEAMTQKSEFMAYTDSYSETMNMLGILLADLKVVASGPVLMSDTFISDCPPDSLLDGIARFTMASGLPAKVMLFHPGTTRAALRALELSDPYDGDFRNDPSGKAASFFRAAKGMARVARTVAKLKGIAEPSCRGTILSAARLHFARHLEWLNQQGGDLFELRFTGGRVEMPLIIVENSYVSSVMMPGSSTIDSEWEVVAEVGENPSFVTLRRNRFQQVWEQAKTATAVLEDLNSY